MPESVSYPSIMPKLKRKRSQHRMFYSTKLHFLPIATENPQTGRVWSTILFPVPGDVMLDVTSPTPQELIIRAARVAGDPVVENLVDGGGLIAGVGIEMSTRCVAFS